MSRLLNTDALSLHIGLVRVRIESTVEVGETDATSVRSRNPDVSKDPLALRVL